MRIESVKLNKPVQKPTHNPSKTFAERVTYPLLAALFAPRKAAEG
jgi:hypothetical protein